MSNDVVPYYFSEAMQNREAQTEHERAIEISRADRNWLKNVFLPVKQAREALADPMHVEKIFLAVPGSPSVDLASVFVMTPGTRDCAFLYTPALGLMHFNRQEQLVTRVQEMLLDPLRFDELLRYVPIRQRARLSRQVAQITQLPVVIDGDVFIDRQHSLEQGQLRNREDLMNELLKLPTLDSMLLQLLEAELGRRFPGVDLKNVVMISYQDRADDTATEPTPLKRQPISQRVLRDAVLEHYRNNGWPDGHTHEFLSPTYTPQEGDLAHWKNAIRDIADSLGTGLQSALQTYWNTEVDTGDSRQTFAARVMGEHFRYTLLQTTLWNETVPEDDHWLKALYPSTPSQPSALVAYSVKLGSRSSLSVELSNALAIYSENENRYSRTLYSPSSGLKEYNQAIDLERALIASLNAPSLRGELLDSLSLQERAILLQLQNPTVSLLSLLDPVFENRMQAIVDKQFMDLNHVLSLYRNGGGRLNPDAAVDCGLDIRAHIHPRLLQDKHQGRWSTRLDLSGNTLKPVVALTPSTLEAGQQQLQALTEQASKLQGLLEQRPDLSAFARLNTFDINTQIEPDRKDFLRNFLQAQRTVYERHREPLIDGIREGLREEARFKAQGDMISATHLALVNALLDSPERAQRHAVNGFLPDAFRMTLTFNDLSQPVTLANCCLITERGGLDPLHSGDVLFWSGEQGLEVFNCVVELNREINRRLLSPDERFALLENITRVPPLPSEHTLGEYGVVPLVGFELSENFLEEQYQQRVDKDLADLQDATAFGLSETLLESLVKACQTRTTHLPHLNKALDAAQNRVLAMAMPSWLNLASPATQHALAALLDQHRQQSETEEDYLQGIASLEDLAHTTLSAKLAKDFPNDKLEPNTLTVNINATRTEAAFSGSLTAFSLLHVDALQGRSISIEPPNPLITDAYLRSLITESMLGTNYRKTLDQHFSSDSPHYLKRQRLFSRQVFWQALQVAFIQHTQGTLSNAGYQILKHVLGMPDGVAREPLDGRLIRVQPLALQADPVDARGLYLIGPSGVAEGPQILFDLQGTDTPLEEFKDEATLIQQLNSPGDLQKKVLGRLSPKARQTWDETVPSTSRPALQLTTRPLRKNLFSQLFQAARSWLEDGASSQTTTGSGEHWQQFKTLITSGLYQGALAMSGRFRLPLMVLQALPAIKGTVVHAWKNQWGASMADFASALAQLAAARSFAVGPVVNTVAEDLESTLTRPTAITLETPSQAPYPVATWGNQPLSDLQRGRLERYEAHDVALSDMTHNSEQHLYIDANTQFHYAPLYGRVFQVTTASTDRRLLLDDEPGLRIKLGTDQAWSFDLKSIENEEGQPNRIMDGIRNRLSIQSSMNIEAIGMRNIRRLYPDKARQLKHGHELALRYLQEARVNVTRMEQTSRWDIERKNFVLEFFGIATISSELVKKIETQIEQLLLELLKPSLLPDTSKRYVVGSSKWPNDTIQAFTVRNDPKKRIFLLDHFFTPAFAPYPRIRPRTFDPEGHNMAVTLIHELTHLYLKTEDIAYLDSVRPFYDLLDISTSNARARRQRLRTLQRDALSKTCVKDELFKTLDESDQWVDCTGKALKRILELTSAPDLNAARNLFLTDEAKRIEVILANADSLTYLISRLGRPLEFHPTIQGLGFLQP